MIKLSEYAKQNGLSYMTAYRHFVSGNLKGKRLHTGTILVYWNKEEEYNEITNDNRVILYARVSSSENKSNLDSQMDRLRNYANAKGYIIINEIKEIGSGMNDKRKKLEETLKKCDKWDKIIVEHKDRLARFGVNYIQILLEKEKKELEIINEVHEEREDLTQDFVSIVTSFCTKLYGLRRTKRKTEEIINKLSGNQKKA